MHYSPLTHSLSHTGFRRMAMTFHPDKNKDPAAADRFKEVSLAYEVLSDVERREMYDVAGEASLHEGFDASFFLARCVVCVCCV